MGEVDQDLLLQARQQWMAAGSPEFVQPVPMQHFLPEGTYVAPHAAPHAASTQQPMRHPMQYPMQHPHGAPFVSDLGTDRASEKMYTDLSANGSAFMNSQF